MNFVMLSANGICLLLSTFCFSFKFLFLFLLFEIFPGAYISIELFSKQKKLSMKAPPPYFCYKIWMRLKWLARILKCYIYLNWCTNNDDIEITLYLLKLILSEIAWMIGIYLSIQSIVFFFLQFYIMLQIERELSEQIKMLISVSFFQEFDFRRKWLDFRMRKN